MGDKIKGGYVIQPRKLDESEIMRMPPVTRELWAYLCRNVNWRDTSTCSRGEGFFHLDKIREDLAWHVGYRREMYSKPQLTKSLRRLCEGNAVETTKETRGIRVRVLKYCYYQDVRNYEGNDEGSTKDSRRVKGVFTIPEEGNKGKEEEEDILVVQDEPKPRENVPYQQILDLYHRTCKTMPEVRVYTPSRKQAVKNRYNQFKDHPKGPLWPFEVLFDHADKSNFLSGRSGRWGGCNFDWLMKQANFVKTIEGNYDNDR